MDACSRPQDGASAECAAGAPPPAPPMPAADAAAGPSPPASSHLVALALLPGFALECVLQHCGRVATMRALLAAARAAHVPAAYCASIAAAMDDAARALLLRYPLGRTLLASPRVAAAHAEAPLELLAFVERLEMTGCTQDPPRRGARPRDAAARGRAGRDPQAPDAAAGDPVLLRARVWSAGRNDCGQGARRSPADINALEATVPFSRIPGEDRRDDEAANVVVRVAAGGRHSAAITARGTLVMCGANEAGQLGVDDYTSRNGWVPVLHLKRDRVAMVACGQQHTVLLTGDGRVLTCGLNDLGQLGIHPPSAGVSEAYASCARKADTPGWMSSHSGSPRPLGPLPPMRCATFTPVAGLDCSDEADCLGGVVQVAAGFSHTVILLGNGKVYAAGYNGSGQLGIRSQIVRQFHFVPVDCYGHRIVRVGCGAETTMFLTRENMVLVTGKRASGLSVIGGLGSSRVTHLSVGDGLAVARTDESHVVVSRFRKRFELPDELLEVFASCVSVGPRHYAMVTEDGGAMACGFNAYGQVASGQMGLTIQGGDHARVIRPYHVPLSRVSIPEGHKVLQVACGTFHTLYILAPEDSKAAESPIPYGL